jgi:hypothetical protein
MQALASLSGPAPLKGTVAREAAPSVTISDLLSLLHTSGED